VQFTDQIQARMCFVELLHPGKASIYVHKVRERMRSRNSSGRGWSMFEEETSFIVSPLPGLGIMVAACAPSGVFILCQRSIRNYYISLREAEKTRSICDPSRINK
jgi:hypothetical protein